MPTPAEELQAFWNQRFAGDEFAYGTEPNAFLAASRPRLPARGRALCLGDGEGRNGVWLAQQGFEVTSVDLSDAGLAKAQRLAAARGVAITTVQADVTTFGVGTAGWDLIALVFLHLPPSARAALHARCAQALAPGGMVLLQAYTPEQLRYATGGPRDTALLPTLADIEADFRSLAVEHAQAGEREVREGRLHSGLAHVVEFIARRPA